VSRLDVPSVSVVIPTRGRPEIVEQSLRELLVDPATSEIVVVVVGSIDEAILTRWRAIDDRVKAIKAGDRAEHPMERGELPRDRGVMASSGEVILALDDDVVPRPGLVSGHARWHASDPRLVVLGYMPVSLDGAGSLAGTARFYGESYERACRRFAADPETILLGLWGGNYSLRRAHWLESTELPRVSAGYHGDREFGLRLRTLGLHAAFDRALRADHLYRRSLWALIENARSAGIGHARLLSAYPELTTNPAAAPPRARARTRLVSRATRSDLAWYLVSPALRAVVGVASSARIATLERLAIRALWQLSFDRGTREVGVEDV
jgi:glycosyltransferase involved in cell wall biosynthesis